MYSLVLASVDAIQCASCLLLFHAWRSDHSSKSIIGGAPTRFLQRSMWHHYNTHPFPDVFRESKCLHLPCVAVPPSIIQILYSKTLQACPRSRMLNRFGSSLAIILNTAHTMSRGQHSHLSSINSAACHATNQNDMYVANFRVVAQVIVTSQWVAETAAVPVLALAITDSARARFVLGQQTSLDLGHDGTPLSVLGSGFVVH